MSFPPKQHTFQCVECGEKWQGGIESPNQFGTYCPCPHCLSVAGSYHDCCEDLQGKELCRKCNDAPLPNPDDIHEWCDDCKRQIEVKEYKPIFPASAARGTYVKSGGRV